MEDVIFVHCETENDLLRKFYIYMSNHPCDVISGWNIWGFDLPYLINRAKAVFGSNSEIWKMLSPINKVRTWKQKTSDELNIDIAGVCILDYYNVYRWYSPKKLENYTLEKVSTTELNVGKMKYDGTFSEFYTNDWDEFVEYNVVDCERVNDLEDKLGYIRQIQALSLYSKAPMKYYNAMTQLIEGRMLAHYRGNDLCAPYHESGSQETFEAAYVKTPHSGLHEWVTELDITSSYPSNMITLNMSLETYFGRIMGVREQDVIYYTGNREFPVFDMFKDDKGIVKFTGKRLKSFNIALEKGLLSIAPCGSVFSTSKTGVIAEVEREAFFKRKEVKDKMRAMRDKASKLPDGKEKEQLLIKAQELFSLQWALKIWLNAFFGILAVPYSRYFNTNIAEAITSCGRRSIINGQRFTNELLNDINKDDTLKNIIMEIDK